MKDRIVEAAVHVLKTEPEGLYCSHLMQRIRDTCPALAHESFGFHLRNWKKEDASAPTPLLATHDETGFFQLAPSSPEPLETYTGEELAELLGVHPATLVEWKASDKIPERFVTPEGDYIKSLIDPLIEAYRQAAPFRTAEMLSEEDRLQMAILHEEGISVQEITLKFHCESSVVDEVLRQFEISTSAQGDETKADLSDRPASRKNSSRKRLGLTQQDRSRMTTMHEQGVSMTEIAATFGCSLSTISRMLRQPKDSTPDEPDDEFSLPPVTTGPYTPPPEKPNDIEFHEFVRQYWSVGTRAVDMLFLPQEVRTRILLAVRDTLRYAYVELNATVSSAHPTNENETPTLLPFAQTPDSLMTSELHDRAKRQEPSGFPTNPRRGRPKGSGKYGCQTKAIRVPAHLVTEVADYARTHALAANGSDGVAYRRTPK